MLQGWAFAFPQQRTCGRAIMLALGLLCGLGRRTLTRAICFYNRQHQDWSADYKLFNRSRWDSAAPCLSRSCKGRSAATAPNTSSSVWTTPGAKRWGKKVKTAFWSRDPLSPPFHANLMWGQRFLQASLLTPLYRFDGESGPRGLPLRFEEVPPVRKPAKRASPLTAKPKRPITFRGPLSAWCTNCAATWTPRALGTKPSLPSARAPSATKPPSATLSSAPS